MRRKKLMTAAIAAFCLMTSAAVPAGISMAAEETETETAAQETSQDESETAAQEAQKREQKQIQKQRRRQRRFPNGRTTMPLTMLHWENIQDLR